VAAWTHYLDDEDLAFLKRFLLASGSLKDLASSYAISYPTVRLRLDRLIQKVRLVDEVPAQSDFERRMRALLADGHLDPSTLKAILDAYAKQKENQDAKPDFSRG
jgi:hypothetical protein